MTDESEFPYRRWGRPSVTPERPTRFHFRASADLGLAIKRAAAADGRSVSSFVEQVLTERLTKDGYISHPAQALTA